jgi:hypothetical protein
MTWSSDLRNGLIRFRRLKHEHMQSKLRRDLDPLDLELVERALWPAPGSEDTELGVLMEPEVDHGEAEVHTRVQA